MCNCASGGAPASEMAPQQLIAHLAPSPSLSGARPDMEHTRLGIDHACNPVSLTLQQRLRQITVLGKTGMGKSTLLKSIVAQDIARGDGLLLIDPHGTLAEECLALVMPARR